ncbi:MAG: 1-(5-phosphoribosyl)-5-[(5-phosphoribosylamino)methylideneamino]imidazole-4-carboxamide isomerase [Thiotrichales bacterium]|nr:1-(5-phosphoribosyl)-5-[(5-phosphoribosylamino)methylideneamino]imidazole-4-carboxamide isomerase [Thiotrichales bacterium]
MLLIPAIDLKGGKCVRLVQGDMERDTVYSDDPVKMAVKWAEAGARRLHLVDLDGAFEGSPINHNAIHQIAEELPTIDIEVGGGIRDEDTIQSYLDAGVRYVILGTKAVTAPHFVSDVCIEFPGHIMVGLDVRDGKVAIDGWSKLSKHDALDLAQRFESDGVEAIIHTDIGRDGMMEGLNVEATASLARELKIPVYASGGVTNLDDIRRLSQVSKDGVSGAITGKALYEGKLDFSEAQALADQLSESNFV